MTKAICCRILLITLLLPALRSLVCAEGLDKTNPEMGYQLASNNPALVEGASASKLDKLNESIRQAAEQYKQGHFDRAAEWYTSALQLDPDRKDLQQSLENAHQMQQAQQKANAQLPLDKGEREKFLSIALSQAQRYYDTGKYPQAAQAFYKLWLTAGDYQGKTLRAYTEAQQKVRALNPGGETAVASAAPAGVAPSLASEPKTEVLLDEVVPPHAEGTADNSPAALEADLNKARAAIKTGYYDDAQRILNDLLARDPNNAAAHSELNKLAALTGDQARRASALANWQKVDDRQVAQAAADPSPLKAVFTAGSAAAATTATLQPVSQPPAAASQAASVPATSSSQTDLPPPAANEPPPAMSTEPAAPAASSNSDAMSSSSATTPPTAAPESTVEPASTPAAGTEVTSASEGNLLPATGASASGGPTGGAAEGAPVTAATDASTAPAPASAEGGPDDLTRLQANRLLRQAELLAGEGKTQDAIKAVHDSMELWPDNPRAQELLQQYTATASGHAPSEEAAPSAAATQNSVMDEHGGSPAQIQNRAELGHQLDELHKQALEAYDAGDLGRARTLWNEMLKLDPGNKLAHAWLDNTLDAYQRQAADKQTRNDIEARSEAAQKLLNSPITISTDHKISLAEFMNALSYVTPVGLQYYLAQGSDAQIFANFTNKPLREVLDTVLVPIGLSWSIDEKNVITIQPKLISRTYPLKAQQMSQVRALMDSGEFQRMVWGQTEKPAPGVDLTLDERQNILIVTGSEIHIKRVDSFLPSLQVAGGTDLEFRDYKIRAEDGPRIKALINSIIQAQPETPFSLERKILVDGDDLIIRDTPENITKIEDLLTNRKFIQDLRNDKLDIQNFSLVPKDVENIQSDEVQAFTARVVEAIQVFLYNTDGIKKAAEEGRRMWYDPATLQLTVVDTPTNLQRVEEYIDSLPERSQKSQQKVIFLKYQVADTLNTSLHQIWDFTYANGSTAGAASGANSLVVTLRRGADARTFHGATFRVIRVDAGSSIPTAGSQSAGGISTVDRYSTSVELQVTVPGTGPQQPTIQDLATVQVDDFEITALAIQASASSLGDGSAQLRIDYAPQDLSDQALSNQNTATAPTAGNTLETNGWDSQAITDINAIVLIYTDAEKYQQLEDLIQQLDVPTKQVEIETKFVQVNETRAKEFSSDFNFGQPSGTNLNLDNPSINTRFAQDIDQFTDPFSPPLTSPLNAGLLPGTTAISMIFGGAANLTYNLRLLEAEGIINVVNGPKVLALNNEEAEFRIETTVPSGVLGTGTAGGTTALTATAPATANTLAQSLTISNPISDALTNTRVTVADTDSATPVGGALAAAVILRMTPNITSENSIILNPLSAELIDFDGYLAEYATQSITQDSAGNLLPGNQATLPNVPVLKRKKIITYARIANGGTIVVGGWTGENSQEYTSGIPVLRNMPFLGKLLFSRNQRSSDRTTLLIFLTGYIVN